MTMRRIVLLSGILAVAGIASPALAGCDDYPEKCWWRAHHEIYHMENFIARLEANPRIDDADKGPAIADTHDRILHVRAAIGPRWPHWPSPCCYSRRPIYIR